MNLQGIQKYNMMQAKLKLKDYATHLPLILQKSFLLSSVFATGLPLLPQHMF